MYPKPLASRGQMIGIERHVRNEKLPASVSSRSVLKAADGIANFYNRVGDDSTRRIGHSTDHGCRVSRLSKSAGGYRSAAHRSKKGAQQLLMRSTHYFLQ